MAISALLSALCLATLAAAATQQAPSGGSGSSAARWNVVPLTYDCDQQLDGIVDEMYLSKNAVTDVKVNGQSLCGDDCLTDCASMLKPLFQGYFDKLCPPEELIRRCLQVAPGNWTDFVEDCEYFSSIGGTKPSYSMAQLSAGQGGARAGTGCFPGFQQATDFQSWLANNFTSTPNPTPAAPQSLGPVVSGFHFPVVKPKAKSDCDFKLARVLDESYTGPLSADLPQAGGPACDKACRKRCGTMIMKVFNGTTPANETCPAGDQLRDCMAVARPQWVQFVRDCEGLEKGIAPRAYSATGNVIGGEAEAEGRRRLLSFDAPGDDPFWADDYATFGPQGRHLLHGLEGEGEHEGAHRSIDPLHIRQLLAEGEANSAPLPTLTARGPPRSPITETTSAFTRASAPAPGLASLAAASPGPAAPAVRRRASAGEAEAQRSSAAEAAEGRRRILAAPAPGAPRTRSSAGESEARRSSAAEAAEGRRRILSTEPIWRSDEGEHEVWAGSFAGPGQHAAQLRTLLAEAEREGEREGRVAGVLGTSSLRGAESVVQPRYRTLLAEALEGEAGRVALPSLTARGPAKAPLDPLAPATSAFTRAGGLYSYVPPTAGPVLTAGEAEGEAATPGKASSKAEAEGEGEAGEGLAATGQDPREYGCLPDFHTWGDFDSWLQGQLTIAPRPSPDHGRPNAIGLASIAVFVAGMFGLAFF